MVFVSKRIGYGVYVFIACLMILTNQSYANITSVTATVDVVTTTTIPSSGGPGGIVPSITTTIPTSTVSTKPTTPQGTNKSLYLLPILLIAAICLSYYGRNKDWIDKIRYYDYTGKLDKIRDKIEYIFAK